VIQRRPFSSASRNGHGREVAAFGIAYAVPDAVFWPEESVEMSDGGQRVVRPARLSVPFGEPTDPRDQWLVDGLTYEAQGDTSRWANPFTGAQFGGVLTLRRVTG